MAQLDIYQNNDNETSEVIPYLISERASLFAAIDFLLHGF